MSSPDDLSPAERDRLLERIYATGGRYRRRRQRAFTMGGLAAVALLVAVPLIATAGDDRSQVNAGQGEAPVTTQSSTTTTGPERTVTTATSAPSTTTTAPTTTTALPVVVGSTEDRAAAIAFVDAWRRGDRPEMERWADPQVVDMVMSGPRPSTAEIYDWSLHQDGTLQGLVDLDDGSTVYFLMQMPDEPGPSVRWVGVYYPH